MEFPTQGQKWRYFKGGVYTIVRVARMETDLTPVVVYENENGVWVCPVAEFLEITDYTVNDQRVPRFRKVG